MACYKHFNAIKQNIQQGKVSMSNCPNMSTTLRNADIDKILRVLTSKQADIYDRRATVTIGEYLEYIVCLICRRVGDQRKADEALLLPSVYKEFIKHANTAPFSHTVHVQVCEGDVSNARWLLSRLHLYFENILEVQCRHRRDQRKADEAMLLPSVYKEFIKHANTAPFSHTVQVQVCEGNVSNARWLLSRLH